MKLKGVGQSVAAPPAPAPASFASRLNLPLASPLDLSEDRVWRKGEIKRLNLETTDRIKELVQELDHLVAAGERPFGKYLDKIGGYPAPPGAIYDFEQVWKRRSSQLEAVRFRIERFGCQLNWLRRDGQPGYWHASSSAMSLPMALARARVKFDYSTLKQPLEPEQIEAEFYWLAFKDSDLRWIEARDGLAACEADLILNALATTPIYGSKPGGTFLQVQHATEVSSTAGEGWDVSVRLPRKCYSVLCMLNATSGWCDTLGRGIKVARCRCCEGRYLLDSVLLDCHVPRGEDRDTWQYDYTCWRCRVGLSAGQTKVTQTLQ
jgi:hypothetical protein